MVFKGTEENVVASKSDVVQCYVVGKKESTVDRRRFLFKPFPNWALARIHSTSRDCLGHPGLQKRRINL
jgi:hypothetical protein